MNKLPPVIELLKNEMFSNEDLNSKNLFENIRTLIPELRQQAEWSAANHEYIDGKGQVGNTEFAVSPASGINPFSDLGKCADLDCRVKVAENFSRTIGLYSDVIYLPDPLTTSFLDEEDVGWTDEQIIKLLNEIIVIKTLSPLIDNGIIKFVSPVTAFCTSCYEKLSEQIYDFSDQAVTEFWESILIESNKDYLALDTGILHEPNLVFRKYYDPSLKNRKNTKKLARELLFNLVSEDVHEHLLTMHEASSMNSTVLSNSRAGLQSLKKLEGHDPKVFGALDWESSRTTILPWVKDLTPSQVIELRESASNALPQFRELIHRNMAASDQEAMIDNNEKCSELILELRSQAQEVRSELDAINIKSEKNFHNVGGLLGISVALYSSAIGNPLVGLSTLIASLGLIHTNLKKDESEVKKLTSKPGYILIKAQEIINTHN